MTTPSLTDPHSGASRRSWTTAEKATAVRRHLRDGVSVADLAEELGTAPTQVYGWIKLVMERAELALTDKREKTVSCGARIYRMAESLKIN